MNPPMKRIVRHSFREPIPKDDTFRIFSESEKIAFDLGFSWFEHLANTVDFGNKTIELYILKINEEIRVALPLCLPFKPEHRAEALSNYYTTLYAPILATDTSEFEITTLLKSVFTDYPYISEIRLAPLDPEASSTIKLRNALLGVGWRNFSYFTFGNWYLPVEGDWENYLLHRSGSLRSNIRRANKRFFADGGRLEIISGNDESIEKASKAFESVYNASWKNPEPHPKFIPGLIKILAADGRLRLGIAWINDTPVATQLWIVNHGKANIYKVAYDENYSALSPATVLTAHLMNYVIDVDRVYEVDYLMGDDKYKSNWMSHRRERCGIVAYKLQSIRGFLGYSKEWFSRKIKPLRLRLKRHLSGQNTSSNS
jgi:hypothetical protein